MVDNFVNDGVELGRTGALANDGDTAFGKGSTYYWYGATFARALSAAGLPEDNGARTVEGWVKFNNTVVLARWGEFSVGATSRALTIKAGQRDLEIPVEDLSLADSKWHHLAIAYDEGRFTGYVDGQGIGSVAAGGALATSTNGGFEAGIIPTGSSNGYFDELAIYPRALTGAEIRNHLRAEEDAAPTDPVHGQTSVVANIEGPTRVRRGRENRFWVTLENLGPTTAHGAFVVLRLPTGVRFRSALDASAICERFIQAGRERGAEISESDERKVLDSTNCKPQEFQTTTAPLDFPIYVPRLEAGALVRHPIDLVLPSLGEAPLTLGSVQERSDYYWSGSGGDFARDPVMKAMVADRLAAAGADPSLADSPELMQSFKDTMMSMLTMPLGFPTSLDGPGLVAAIGVGVLVRGALTGNGFVAAAGAAIVTAAGIYAFVSKLKTWLDKVFNIESRASLDPNDKFGPQGAGGAHWVSGNSKLPYVIHFENDPEKANAPAQLVEIADTLAAGLDADTVRFQEIVVADHRIALSKNDDGSYAGTYDPPGEAAPIRAEARFDVQTRQVRFRIFGQGDGTGQDQYADFLPPDVDQPEGEGYVAFTIRPHKEVADGTTIENKATITFDSHEAGGSSLDTPTVSNRVDRGEPSGKLAALPAETRGAADVRWDGTDAASGVKDYTVWVSRDGGPLTPWLNGTPETSASFSGVVGSRYGFVVQARDATGNREPLKHAVEGETTILAPLPTPSSSPGPDPVTTTSPGPDPVTTTSPEPSSSPTVQPGDIPGAGRVLPRRLLSRTSLRRGNRGRYQIVTRGHLVLPAGMRASASSCAGTVGVTVRARKRLLARIPARLNRRCKFVAAVEVPLRRPKVIRSVTVRFSGNKLLRPLTRRSRIVAPRPARRRSG